MTELIMPSCNSLALAVIFSWVNLFEIYNRTAHTNVSNTNGIIIALADRKPVLSMLNFTEYPGTGVVINQGDDRIHQQYCEGNPVRIGTPRSYYICEQSDADHINNPAAWCGRGGYWISNNKKRSQHDAACKKCEYRRQINTTVVPVEQQAD